MKDTRTESEKFNDFLKQRSIDHKFAEHRSEVWFLDLWKAKYPQYYIKTSQTIGAFIVDFIFGKMVFEVDGSSHNTTKQHNIDKKKDKYLKSKCFIVVRIKAYDQISFEHACTRFNDYIAKLSTQGIKTIEQIQEYTRDLGSKYKHLDKIKPQHPVYKGLELKVNGRRCIYCNQISTTLRKVKSTTQNYYLSLCKTCTDNYKTK